MDLPRFLTTFILISVLTALLLCFLDQGFRSEDFFQRNKKGDIEILTGYAKEILIKLQTGVYIVYSFRD